MGGWGGEAASEEMSSMLTKAGMGASEVERLACLTHELERRAVSKQLKD